MTLKDIHSSYERKVELTRREYAENMQTLRKEKETRIKAYYRQRDIDSGKSEVYYSLNSSRVELAEIDKEENNISEIRQHMLFFHPTKLSSLTFLFRTEEDREIFKEKYNIGSCTNGIEYQDK